jgi:TDG/mug DNA glycosylase family protein
MNARSIHGFPPVAAPDARVVILGTMPGEASLKAGQYYAYPRNAFWRIMGELVGAGPDKPYAERLRILRAKRLALWDVLEACIRPGSLDASIGEETPNDFARFFAEHPEISHVGLNGGTAAKLFKRYAATHCPKDVQAVRLPSTSPAYAAMRFEEKCAKWRAFLRPANF